MFWFTAAIDPRSVSPLNEDLPATWSPTAAVCRSIRTYAGIKAQAPIPLQCKENKGNEVQTQTEIRQKAKKQKKAKEREQESIHSGCSLFSH